MDGSLKPKPKPKRKVFKVFRIEGVDACLDAVQERLAELVLLSYPKHPSPDHRIPALPREWEDALERALKRFLDRQPSLPHMPGNPTNAMLEAASKRLKEMECSELSVSALMEVYRVMRIAFYYPPAPAPEKSAVGDSETLDAIKSLLKAAKVLP